MFRWIFQSLVLTASCVSLLNCVTAAEKDSPSFNRDIRPILAKHCWKCHGVDAAIYGNNVRFDQEQRAGIQTSSGATPIVPGSPETSEILRRLRSEDPAVRMPPPADSQLSESGPSSEEVRQLEQWIQEGAKFEQHWSFSPLKKPAIPAGFESQNPVDAFVLSRLQDAGLSLSPEADRSTLLRRLALDMTGLPPDRVLIEHRDASWDQLIERVLASPHFGERLAVDWLDAARYADTNGYFGDKPRQIWLWRDWVINAFNSNMPFDQFTIEQLAGDLLPSPTVANRIATGFNRNHVANNETGIIDEEFRVEYVADRVSTTMATWMGLTAGCAQCHDHKYDPVSQQEYYSLFAFFNNIAETGLITTDNPPPLIRVTTKQQDAELSRLAAERTQHDAAFEAIRPTIEDHLGDWLSGIAEFNPNPDPESRAVYADCEGLPTSDWHYRGTPVKFSRGVRGFGITFDGTQHLESRVLNFNTNQPWTLGFWMYPEGTLSCPVSKISNDERRSGLEILWQKGRINVALVNQWGVSSIGLVSNPEVIANKWHHVVVSYDGGLQPESLQLYLNGIAAPSTPKGTQLHAQVMTDAPLMLGRREPGPGTYGVLDEFQIFQRQLTSEEIARWARLERVVGIAERGDQSRTAEEQNFLLSDFIAHECDESIQAVYRASVESRAAEKQFADQLPVTLVMEELPMPRVTHVLERGQYNFPGVVVMPDVPRQFGAWPDRAPRNRLGLAHWIVSPENTLTSRVAVNRMWKLCFGEGLVRTPGDFGIQGDFPSHPELLDWLAATYQESGWDTKAMLRIILTSRVYRQSSRGRSAAAEQIDPQNRLLWKAPVYRLPAEMIRDQALAVSDLLCRDIGGPSVKPFQPDGLWEEVSYNGEDSYIPDTGAGRYRRSLYTFIKRQSPPPALLIFDGPTREKCTLQRPATNTPLQALVTLNDPTYLEASRALAARILNSSARGEPPLTTEHHIRSAFEAVLIRPASELEVITLLELFRDMQKRFSGSDEEVEELLSGESLSAGMQANRVELAALTIVVHTILNLDEAITRR